MRHDNATEDMPIIFGKPYIALGGGLLRVGEILTLQPCNEVKGLVSYYCETLGGGKLSETGSWRTRFKFPEEAEFNISMMDELL